MLDIKECLEDLDDTLQWNEHQLDDTNERLDGLLEYLLPRLVGIPPQKELPDHIAFTMERENI